MAGRGKGEAPIIIKKKKVIAGGGHHGGAWKVAYADFVTAMMAFFLLMWLLNATTEDQRKGLADYFNPSIPISRISGGGNGALNGESVFSEDSAVSNRAGSDNEFPKSKVLEKDGDSDEFDLNGAHEGRGMDDELGAGDGADERARFAKMIAEEAGGGPADLADVQNRIDAETVGALEDKLAEHIHTRMTPDGLVIELVDADGEPLYNLGSSTPSQLLHDLIEVVGPVLATVSNDMAIVGHTDAKPFSASADYTNWELSTDRALAARRLLIANGITGKQIVQVTGKAATEPFADDPLAPQNRRIAITLLTRK
ncbi:flagellar motor protein MotB [Hyphococcus luteus]|uniref:Chemotaxis protein MotB n=1 Tax=Hyphococcus luteus TaxID=2058213 RepID=A0A2S7K1R4_9PROT|nr:flagellar motor protein MotB [Marinicaulis flavus]PQA86436.1 chemotaxis protein MotB [Marinicaulis flavus]